MPTPMLSDDDIRTVRRAYDGLPKGEKAVLKRCRSGGEIQLEGGFWRIASLAPPLFRARLSHVVACFPAADQLQRVQGFRVGSFLRNALYGAKRTLKPGEAVVFRRLLAADQMEDLVHYLRRALTHAGRPVDWGVLGRDVVFWGDFVRRKWAQDFYSPLKEESHV